MRRVIGIIFTVVGAIGEIYALMTISNEKSSFFGYTYSAPFTEHEIMMITIAVVSAIALLIGLIALLVKEKNQQ